MFIIIAFNGTTQNIIAVNIIEAIEQFIKSTGLSLHDISSVKSK